MNKLEEICAVKKDHIQRQKNARPLSVLQKQASLIEKPRGFEKSLRQTQAAGKTALIAEVKKASPSKGIIREDFDPVSIAKIYESAGASCISVLTDIPYFQGSDLFLRHIHENVSLPLLRKDFMIDPYQIIESRALGADCILLIMAALSDAQALELHHAAQELGMDVLVETHDMQEIERALKLGSAMIGVNNRNLKTLRVDIQTGIDLAEKIPAQYLKIAESGIANTADIAQLKTSGYQAFLIGESLMRENDIAAATQKILG